MNAQKFLEPYYITWTSYNNIENYDVDTIFQVGFLIEETSKLVIISSQYYVKDEELYIYPDTILKQQILQYGSNLYKDKIEK